MSSAFKEYEKYDGIGLSELIKKKEVTPNEVLESAIAKIEKLNPRLNAVITKMYDEAKEVVDRGVKTGVFAGVPMLLKDISQLYKGVRYTMGSKLLRDFVPDIDSEFVKRIKNSGALIIGKTNVPEFGLMGTTEPEYFGPTKNPWDLKRTPGGSSGGSAAAVASRMVPVATGNDGGGSIRIPASCCGVFGLKPSRGRTPNGPLNGEIWMGLVVEHALTVSVRDSAAMLDVTAGADTGAPYEIKPPTRSYLKTMDIPPKKLKIAFSVENPLSSDVHPLCRNAVLKTVDLLDELGYDIEEKTLDIDFKELAQSYIVSMFGEVAFLLKDLEKILDKKIKSSDIEMSSWILAKIGEIVPIWKASWAKHTWDMAARKMGEFHKEYDLYLTPTMAQPPAFIGEVVPTSTEKLLMGFIDKLRLGKVISLDDVIEKLAYKQLSRMPYTQLANQTGQPAMSVPLFTTKDGLPIGVHFTAAYGKESLLFKLARQLEMAKPWKDRTALIK